MGCHVILPQLPQDTRISLLWRLTVSKLTCLMRRYWVVWDSGLSDSHHLTGDSLGQTAVIWDAMILVLWLNLTIGLILLILWLYSLSLSLFLSHTHTHTQIIPLQYGEAPPASSAGKKRHYSVPPRGYGSAHNLPSIDQETAEPREWILPASLSFYVAQEAVLLQSMIVEVCS